MSNYNSLKATINANIKTNGNQEITGSVLNSVLNAMVNTLGAGYQYMGVATPSTNPGSPDAKVFYLAATAGTYANFGDLVVSDNEVAILKWDAAWQKDVTGIASAEKVNWLNRQISPVFDTFDDGYYVTSTGVVSTSSNFKKSTPVYIPKGGVINFSAAGYNTAVAMLSKYDPAFGTYAPLIICPDTDVHTYSFTVESAGFYVISYRTAGGLSVSVTSAGILELVGDLQSAIFDYPVVFIDGKYITLNGGVGTVVNLDAPSSYNVYRYAIVECEEGDIFRLTGAGGGAPRLWGFLDSDNRIISVANADASMTDGSITAPVGAALVVFNDNLKTGDFYRVGITKHLESVLQSIKDLEAKYGGGTYVPNLGTPTSGSFIDSNGSLLSSSNFSLSSPFYVPKGGSISVKAAGYNTAVAMIAKIDPATGKYIPVVISTDSTLRTYTTSNVDGGEYVISYHTIDGVEIEVTSVDIWKTVGDLSSSLEDVAINFTNGKWVALNGGIGSVVDVNTTTWDSSYRYAVLGCNPGDVFLINGKGGGTPRLWGFLDENNVLISVAAASSIGINLMVVAPIGASKIVINDFEKTGRIVRYGLKSVYRAMYDTIQENIFAAFDNILGFGDSLTFSAVFTAGNTSRQARVPYPVVLSRISGNTATVVASGGADASYMWEHYQDSINPKTNAIAIVYLGTNNGLTDTVATDAAGTDPSTWANNNTGDYCRIVNKMLTQGYKVLLLRPWTSSGNIADTIAAINDVAEKFQVAVMDAPSTREPKFHLYPDGSGQNSVHLNDIGYAVFAERLAAQASRLGDAVFARILPS